MFLYCIDPLHRCGNAVNLEDKTKQIVASVKKSYCSVLQIGCIPTEVQGVYCNVVLYCIVLHCNGCNVMYLLYCFALYCKVYFGIVL